MDEDILMTLKIAAAIVLPTLLLSACTAAEDNSADLAIPQVEAPEISVDTMKDITRDLSTDVF